MVRRQAFDGGGPHWFSSEPGPSAAARLSGLIAAIRARRGAEADPPAVVTGLLSATAAMLAIVLQIRRLTRLPRDVGHIFTLAVAPGTHMVLRSKHGSTQRLARPR